VAESPEVRATERWFIRQGLPLFVEEYSAGRDVWTRAVPALVALFVISVVATIAGARTLGGGLALAAGVAVALGIYVLVNRRAGRPGFSLPPHLGLGWVAAFVVVPSLLTLVAERDLALFVSSLVGGVLLLGLVYVVTRYALVAQVSWAVRWTFRRLSSVTRLITRVLPLMLLFITFLFINTEVWQVAGTMSAAVLWGSLAVFAGVGVLFIAGRSREEFLDIEVSTDRDHILDLTRGTPIEPAAAGLAGLEVPVPMRRSQRANLVAVMVTAQAVQVGLVGIVVWAFFIVFGTVAISADVQAAWLGSLSPVETLIPLWDGHGVTRQLLRVSTFLGGFAAFYATVYAASDSLYRENFLARISETVERALAVRRAYVALRRREGLQVDVPPTGLPEPDGDDHPGPAPGHHDGLPPGRVGPRGL
jgi:hypothetical protein